MRRRLGDRGSGTLWVLAVSMVVLVAALAGTMRAAAVVARHRAAAAADFAALAGAIHALSGPGSACASARSVAEANGGQLTRCDVAGAIVTVRVTYRLGAPLARWNAQSMARAGPAP